jgi:hypothetical protein
MRRAAKGATTSFSIGKRPYLSPRSNLREFFTKFFYNLRASQFAEPLRYNGLISLNGHRNPRSWVLSITFERSV